MSEDSSDESMPYIESYRGDPEWSDIKPIPQDDGPYPVVAIAYPEQYTDVYDYFRGVVAVKEKSERVLRLCTDAVSLNPANYTVWQYRREVLKHLKSDLSKELRYIGEVIRKNFKNYQTWNHRRIIVEWYGCGTQELTFTAEMLQYDAKNYHTWQHRQWALTTFQLFDNELEYVNQLLEGDVRNNSVWNHRYFVIRASADGFSPKVVDNEVDFVIDQLNKAILNESAWNYLRGILIHTESKETRSKAMSYCRRIYERGDIGEHTFYMLSFYADSLVEEAENSECPSEDTIKLATEIYQKLAEQYDPMREKYWKHILCQLMKRYPSNQA